MLHSHWRIVSSSEIIHMQNMSWNRLHKNEIPCQAVCNKMIVHPSTPDKLKGPKRLEKVLKD